MTGLKKKVYHPDKAATKVYARLYKLYMQLHDAFGTGGYEKSLANIMKDLLDISNDSRS